MIYNNKIHTYIYEYTRTYMYMKFYMSKKLQFIHVINILTSCKIFYWRTFFLFRRFWFNAHVRCSFFSLFTGWSLGRRMHILVRIAGGHHSRRLGNERRDLSSVRSLLSSHWVISLLFFTLVTDSTAQLRNPEINTVSLTFLLIYNY